MLLAFQWQYICRNVNCYTFTYDIILSIKNKYKYHANCIVDGCVHGHSLLVGHAILYG